MKITRIKALCKGERHCMIYERGKRQYIGTLNAAYPSGNIAIEKESIRTLFDWPDVAKELRIEVVEFKNSRLCPVHDWMNDLIQLQAGPVLTYIDETIVPLMYEHGILYVKEAYINAAEKTEGYTLYYLAENADGELLVIMGDGLISTAIIKPIPRTTASNICRNLEKMGSLVSMGWPDDNNTIESQQLPGQMNMEEMMGEQSNDGQ